MTIEDNPFAGGLELSGEESAILAKILKGELSGDLEPVPDQIRPRDVFFTHGEFTCQANSGQFNATILRIE